MPTYPDSELSISNLQQHPTAQLIFHCPDVTFSILFYKDW